MFSLNDILFYSVVDHVIDETRLYILMDQIMRNAKNGNIGENMKSKFKLYLKDGVTLLMKPTRGSAKFDGSKVMKHRACPRGTTTETYRDVAYHNKTCQFDEKIAYCGSCTPSTHDEEFIFPDSCPVFSGSPTNLCDSFPL